MHVVIHLLTYLGGIPKAKVMHYESQSKKKNKTKKNKQKQTETKKTTTTTTTEKSPFGEFHSHWDYMHWSIQIIYPSRQSLNH